jgi:hypothetical protein
MADSTLQPSQPHAALIWLIRGTGILIAIVSALTGCFLAGGGLVALCRTHPGNFFATLAALLVLVRTCGISRTKIVLIVIFVIAACDFLAVAAFSASRGNVVLPDLGWFGVSLFSLGMFAVLGLLGMIFGLLVKKGYEIWCRIDKATVTDFAFVFALFAARVFHYSLPAHLQKLSANTYGRFFAIPALTEEPERYGHISPSICSTSSSRPLSCKSSA